MKREYQEREIDRHFAAFIYRQVAAGEVSDLLRLVVSLASSAVGEGNSCMNLTGIAEESIVMDNREFRLPRLDALMELLGSASVVTVPGGERRPLVLDGSGRLYLYRYWRYEQDLAGVVLQKAAAPVGYIDETLLQGGLARLFPASGDGEIDRQKEAAVAALNKQFTVISGGPGTGKTSTVVRILALLIEQHGERNRIALAAPTGKAAARLKASISLIKSTLDCSDEVKSAIPDDVVTIQRLLGTLSASARFRHSAQHPLPFDTVIVDEASMVALPLMTALVTALRPDARLVLLGDRDQLASVEAGAVLGDICSAAEEQPSSPLGGSLVVLEKNYRFEKGSGIVALSRAVNAARDREALELLKSSAANGIAWIEDPGREGLTKFLSERVIEGYRSSLEAGSPAESLERFERFRILCALREGPYGVSGINAAVESILCGSGLISRNNGTLYRGRPVMVTVNDYSMRLFNGDTGVLFPDPENGGAIRAFFPSPDATIRSIAYERLPQHDTAFAITIHKSQGSEFDRVLMLLPPADCEILTRELLYTGITRAKQGVEILACSPVFCSAVRRKRERNSGLRDALHRLSVVS